ncbi:polysaccharide pyruvyl transferase family protein [Flavimaricola sp.]|nr:polysaccharide pyruvyl transferase family protein [Flavimaricola sp.]MDA9020163.1 polysaccharide pyruvyl transferase family protein [Flavimaricola sp.]
MLAIFDTAKASANLGDRIIMEAVNEELNALLGNKKIVLGNRWTIARVATHRPMNIYERCLVRFASRKIVGGTNLLNGDLDKVRQWRFSDSQIELLSGSILLGCGWRSYEGAIEPTTAEIWNNILCKNAIHSVRDEYTKNKLREIGIVNVVNTSCPTMWSLNEWHCRQIPKKKSDRVVFTLTDYNRDVELDREMIGLLRMHYSSVFFWPQSLRDIPYFEGLGIEGVLQLEPTVKAFDAFLESEKVDYVGTRLHAAIRALQFKRRALVIAVDNRGAEIGNDTHLHYVQRGEMDLLEKWIGTDSETKIEIPLEAIETWRNQFRICNINAD